MQTPSNTVHSTDEAPQSAGRHRIASGTVPVLFPPATPLPRKDRCAFRALGGRVQIANETPGHRTAQRTKRSNPPQLGSRREMLHAPPVIWACDVYNSSYVLNTTNKTIDAKNALNFTINVRLGFTLQIELKAGLESLCHFLSRWLLPRNMNALVFPLELLQAQRALS